MATGLLYDPRYLDHDPGRGHPECRERLTRTLAHLETLPWFPDLVRVPALPAAEEWIRTIHSPAYIRRAEEACAGGAGILDTPDVGVSRGSFEAALLAAGGALGLADAVMEGRVRNGFGLLRPPGHHAERDFAMGFCLFNNIAILAEYLRRKHGLERILILDWDVHHGNGTQHAFEEDPGVLYVSLHQYPFYPGTGAVWETGKGRGAGATLNCPMRAGSGDAEYEEAFRSKILPKIEAFRPDIILVSAGFDAHARDPLAQINLSSPFFAWMTERAVEAADRHARGRLIALLEGGYNLDVLPECIANHLSVLVRASAS
jgi:acetoin utilization deacetylase AcuC-like enzyme